MVKHNQPPLNSVFYALSDPTRRAILARLATGESRVTDLARPFVISLPAVSKHLRVLERAGLIHRRKDGRVRRCRLQAAPLKDAADWLSRYRIHWEQQFDALARYLEEAQRQGGPMPTPSPDPATTLRITRTFPAPRDQVFRAWTEPAQLERWFARATDQHTTRVHALDLRAGGSYRIEMKNPEGRIYLLVGTYREVTPPERLVYTWKLETDPQFGETLVTVEFAERGGSTEVRLTHERFLSKEALEAHSQRWNACLDTLAKVL